MNKTRAFSSTHPARAFSAKATVFWVAAIAFGAGTVAAMLLFQNISIRKAEALNPVLRVVDITETLTPEGATFQQWQLTQLQNLSQTLASGK